MYSIYIHILLIKLNSLGLTKETDPKKIEQDVKKNIPEKYWSEIGFSMSFLGMDICRHSDPKHEEWQK
jgi:endonuclease-3